MRNQRPGFLTQPRRGTGFTLVELLVVIAVLAILAALLLPGLQRAKEQGYTTRCKSNLRQWGVAMRLYLNDFQAFSPYEMKDNPSAVALYWHQRLQPYTATIAPDWGGNFSSVATKVWDSIYICPSYIRLGGLISGPGTWSYGYNQSGYNARGGELGLGEQVFTNAYGEALAQEGTAFPGVARSVREPEVIAPHDMLAMADAELIGGFGTEFPSISALIFDITTIPDLLSISNNFPVNDWSAVQAMKQRHLGLWNTLFCDGHVEGLKAAALWYPTPTVTQRWNRDHQAHPEHFYIP